MKFILAVLVFAGAAIGSGAALFNASRMILGDGPTSMFVSAAIGWLSMGAILQMELRLLRASIKSRAVTSIKRNG